MLIPPVVPALVAESENVHSRWDARSFSFQQEEFLQPGSARLFALVDGPPEARVLRLQRTPPAATTGVMFFLRDPHKVRP